MFPKGRKDGKLWQPWLEAKDRVERYADDPQVPGCEADWLAWDPVRKRVGLGLYDPPLPSRCDRFVGRQCPFMVGSGAEPSHPECNYWVSPRFEALVPKLELNPEWQRFDCHRYYALFQNHLCLAELAASLEASWELKVCVSSARQESEVREYAKLTAHPERFLVEKG
jgi:hypothetical protein